MDKPLPQNFSEYSNDCIETLEALMTEEMKPKKQTIANLMAYSKALKIENYSTLGQQEIILN